MYKICIPEPFLNCEKVYPIQQRKVRALINDLEKKIEVKRIIIFGSSVNGNCHIGSDVDIYVELEKERKHLLDDVYYFVYDLWTNLSVDERLKEEIERTGVLVYERDSSNTSKT